jgi:hypothetical protein
VCKEGNDPWQENRNQDFLLLTLASYDNSTSQQDNLSHVTSYETSRIQQQPPVGASLRTRPLSHCSRIACALPRAARARSTSRPPRVAPALRAPAVRALSVRAPSVRSLAFRAPFSRRPRSRRVECTIISQTSTHASNGMDSTSHKLSNHGSITWIQHCTCVCSGDYSAASSVGCLMLRHVDYSAACSLSCI